MCRILHRLAHLIDSTGASLEAQPSDNHLVDSTGASLEAQPSDTVPCDIKQHEDEFFDRFVNHQIPAIIFIVNGYQIHSVICGHDNRVLITATDKYAQTNLIYKHAVSLIQKNFHATAHDLCYPNIPNPNFGPSELEQRFLDKCIRKAHRVCFITRFGGHREYGVITAHDEKAIYFIRNEYDQENLLYKHSLSTIVYTGLDV